MPPLPRADLDALLGLVAWRDLEGAHVALTGATGFYGMWLVESLLHANRELSLGLRVTAVARDAIRARARFEHLSLDAALTFVAADVRRPLDLDGPTHVLHAATSASAALNEGDPLEMLSTIVDGTRHALDASRGCARFLLTSSGAVYGRQPPELALVSEDYTGGPDPISPRSAYAEGKRLAELLCALAAARGHVPAVIARGFAFVGPWLPLHAHFAVGNFVRDALSGSTIVVGGDGTPLRSYLYGVDLVAWALRMLLEGQPGRAYNLGSERAVSIGELAHAVGRLFGCPVEVRGTPTGAPAERYVPSTQRAREELGLRETVSLDDALARTVAWHRSLAEGSGPHDGP
jgi:nucleoside-diphosphate-sugar epimerase